MFNQSPIEKPLDSVLVVNDASPLLETDSSNASEGTICGGECDGGTECW